MRKFALLAVLLCLCIGGVASAQGTMPTFCGTLSDADCAILTNAETAMRTLDSASFDLTVQATATNVPDEKEPVTFSLVGNGSYIGAASVQSMMMGMMSGGMPDFKPEDIAQMYLSVLQNLDFDLNLTLALPPQAVAEDPSVPSNITLQMRLVDGIGYVNLDPLQPIINQPNLKGWAGLDLANLLKTLLEQRPDLFEGMGATAMSGMDMGAYMHDMTDPAFLNQFLTITRTDDGSGDTATFQMTFDFPAMMSSPAMHDMMMQQMRMQGTTMTDEEMQQAMEMSTQMMQGMTMTIDEEIGIADGFIHSVHGTFVFDTSTMMPTLSSMDSGKMKKQSPASTEEPAPVVSVDFTLTFRDFNSAPPITAPEDAMVFPYQLLLSGLLPTPTPTATTVFVPTAVPSPTPTGTVEATPEVTLEPTAEATEPGGGGEPTAEVTEPPGGGGGEVTEEPTVTATASEEPTVTATATDVPTQEVSG